MNYPYGHFPTRNVYWDMDDTLCRTTDWFRQKTKDYLIERNDFDGLREYQELIENDIPYLNYPQKFMLINKELTLSKGYILEAKPTPLFSYFWLFHGHQPEGVNFNVITHRGVDEDVETMTREWFSKQNPVAELGRLHCLNHVDHPSKIRYLEKLHPDRDFILIDDNPLFDIETVHKEHPCIRIYDQYSSYGEAYSNQKRIVFQNGIYLL